MAAKKKAPAARAFDFYLSNGEWFASLTFTREQVRRWFKGAKVKGDSVFLA